MDKKQTKRRWHSKVRTGCDKCKLRRIKCDEKRPQCSQCERSGSLCTGYNTPKPRIFEISTGPEFDSDLERQNYAYFANEGALMVTTFQPSAGDFWRRIGLQISHDFPAVKHGITAVGAIQGPLHHTPSGRFVKTRQPEMSPLALTSLAKGMHLASVANPSDAPLEVHLASCIFFMAAAIWTDKIGAPAVHIEGALRMLEEYSNSTFGGTVSRKDEIETVFIPMFQRFAVNACTFSDGFPAMNTGIPPNYGLDLDLNTVETITTIENAFESVNTILKCVLRLREGLRKDGIFARASHALDRIEDALTHLYLVRVGDAEALSSTGHTFDHDYRHLRMHLATIRIMFNTATSEDEMRYDEYRKEFLFVLVECKKLLGEEITASTKHSSNLRTTLGMIPPLFFVATRCRDIVIRHQAVDLLHATSRAERGWTSCMATSLARFVIDQEHSHAGSAGETQAPNQRIRLESVKFSSADGKAYVDYWECLSDQMPLVQGSSFPYRPHPSVERDGVTDGMARKVLHAFGHTGIVLYSPRIACHCA